jgi:hypothetical protein
MFGLTSVVIKIHDQGVKHEKLYPLNKREVYMPKVDDVGHSDYTVTKMEVLSKIFDMHFMITQAVIMKYPSFRRKYRYVDMTAGKGYVPYSDIVSKVNKVHALEWTGKSLVHNGKLLGSPLVFLTIAESEKVKISYRGEFIEAYKDKKSFAIEKLARNGNQSIFA